MENKVCKSCGKEKSVSEYNFRKDSGKHRNICKECQSKYLKNYYKNNSEELNLKSSKRYENNKNEYNDIRRSLYKTNKENILSKNKEYRVLNRAKVLEQKMRYRENNKDKIAKSRKNHKKNHPEYYNSIKYKLTQSLRSRVRSVVKKGYKSDYTMKLLGCDVITLINHLESKFRDGMSWDKYGNVGWHIDHIIPCNSFDLTDPIQQKKCFHYTNLQPLWYWENCSKSDSIL